MHEISLLFTNHTLVASAAVRSKAVILLLLIRCFLMHPLFVGVKLGLVIVMYRRILCYLFLSFKQLAEEVRACCFTCIVFLLPYHCYLRIEIYFSAFY